jgi:hypothetical protein
VICPTCKTAGKRNTEARRESDLEKQEILYGLAAQFHADCKGGCDCQHKTGDYHLNALMMGET